MFEIKENGLSVPIKVWLSGEDKLDEKCRDQAYNLAHLPFLHKWVCLMPDTHAGKGMPIGGVIAAKNTVIPNAVGTDIGCGMIFTSTNIKVADIKDIQTGNGSIIQSVIGDLMRNIPAGREKFKERRFCQTIAEAKESGRFDNEVPELLELFEDGYFQIGTLGGGNHFIELQEDSDGNLCIMIHSGSRNIGAGICRYFHELARNHASRWKSTVPDDFCLAFLPADSGEGRAYLKYMELAVEFAKENRLQMLHSVKEAVKNKIEKFTGKTVLFSGDLDCVHNYASLEEHFGEMVWVHRKGAVRVRKGEKAVIPGAMGSHSYVVEGKGNPESFDTASHGAGRDYSRTAAMEKFSVEKVMVDLKEQGIILGKRKKADIAEECRFAYKDIDEVMEQQEEMVMICRKMRTVGVIKG